MRNDDAKWIERILAGDEAANDEGIYHLQGETDTWKQIAPEISGVVTSLVVDADTFYVGRTTRCVAF